MGSPLSRARRGLGERPAVLAMVAGMIVAMTAGMAFVPFFGALEVLLPASLAGMLAGMLAPMFHRMAGFGPGGTALLGAACGLVVLAWTHYVSARESRA